MNKIGLSLLCVSLALVLSCGEKLKPDEETMELIGKISSSSEEESSSSAEEIDEDEFDFCVYVTSKFCIKGTFKNCPEDYGWVSNSCPYSDTIFVNTNSSSSGARPSSSSVIRPSSSSGASSGPYCQLGSECSQRDRDLCGMMGGTVVESCPVAALGEYYE
jgi:hypothetical protein